MTVTIENTNVDTALNIAELTTASLTGTGVFDVLLQTLRLHLDREFTSGRITGTAYATVYSQALTAVLQQSVGFCLSKAKLALELQQMQEQVVLLQKQQDQITATIRQTDYITDYQLPAETALKSYELTDIKPAEKAQIVAQTSHITKQELGTIQQTSNLASQQSQIEAQTAQLLYQTTSVLPEEVKISQYTQDRILAESNKISNETVVTIKQGRLLEAQIAQTLYTTESALPAETALKAKELDVRAYELTNIKPQELALVTQQVATQQYTVATRMPAEVAGIQAETSLKAYELSNVQPAQVAQIVAQTSHVTKQELSTIQQTANLVTEQANMVKQGALVDSQKIVADNQALSITAEKDLKVYELTDIKPTQKAQIQAETSHIAKQELNTIQQTSNLTSQKSQVEAQTAQVTYTTTNLLPSQLAQTTAQTSLLTYDLGTVKPVEVVNLTKQGTLLDGQKTVADKQALSIEAETAQVVYKTTYVVPEEVKIHQFTQDRILAEVNKLSNETVVSIKQGRLVDAQVAQTTSQTGLYTQKIATELAQTTSTPASGSVMGVQNALMVKQAENYERDAEQKAAKIMIDTWNVRRNQDPDLAQILESNRLREQDIGIAVAALLAGLSA